jgi:hypothetical protein
MKIAKFKECNLTVAEKQPQYQPLPVYKREDGLVVSCWKLSCWEKIKVLFTGKVYVGLLTFNKPLQPQLLSLNKKKFIV